MRLNIERIKLWWSEERHRELTIWSTLAISILAVIALNTWLFTCGFDVCPSPRQIQTYQPDEGGRIYDRSGKLMKTRAARSMTACGGLSEMNLLASLVAMYFAVDG